MTTITLRGALDDKPWEAKVEGRRFSHYVGSIRYWFAYHKPFASSFGLQITHLDSGCKVCDVPNHALMAARGDPKAAAKATLDGLVQRVGADKVRSVLNNKTIKP